MGTVSAFTPVPEGTNWSIPAGTAVNINYLDTVHEMGDDGTIAGPDVRRSIACVYDLAQFGEIPDDAVVTDVKLTVVPTLTSVGVASGDIDHRFALMASTGGWDRSTLHPLHKLQDGANKKVYGQPSQSASVTFDGYNESSQLIFETNTVGVGNTVLNTSFELPTFGTTFRLPANETLASIQIFMRRLDGDSASLLQLKVYDLQGDGRHFAINNFLKSSISRTYTSVPGSFSNVEFIFDGGLPPSASERWLGVIIEGGAFASGLLRNNARLQFQVIVGTNDDQYRTFTDGSMFTADVDVSTPDNSLNNIQHLYQSDPPHIYDSGNNVVMDTPYKRYKGNILSSADSSATWTSGVPYNYGSPASGQMNVFGGIVAEVQAHLDGVDYNFSEGKTFLGTLLEPNDPDDFLWECAGGEHATLAAPIFEISYSLPPIITSTPPTGFFLTGALFTYDVDATDRDGVGITYSLQQSPSGMVINPSTGVVTWTPFVGQQGLITIKVQAQNNTTLRLSDDQTFVIEVLAVLPVPVVVGTTGKPLVTIGSREAVQVAVRSRESVTVETKSQAAVTLEIKQRSAVNVKIQSRDATDIDLGIC